MLLTAGSENGNNCAMSETDTCESGKGLKDATLELASSHCTVQKIVKWRTV